MQNEFLISLIEKYFDQNPPPFFSFDYGNHISVRKLRNVLKSYAKFDSGVEAPLILIDDTAIFRSAKMGVLITTGHVFYRLRIKRGSNNRGKGQIDVGDIKEMRIAINRAGGDLIVNGEQLGFMIAFGDTKRGKHEGETLNRIFKLLIEELQHYGELPK